MIELTNQLKYTRVNSDGIYHADIEASLRYSVRFDIYNDKNSIATLLTDNKKSFTRTKDNIHLSMKSKWNWRNKWNYFIFRDSDSHLATIYIHRPIIFGWFRPSIYTITFERTKTTYKVATPTWENWKYKNAAFCYDFALDGEIKCRVVNLKRPKGLYNPATATQEGLIEYGDDINLEQILCFLQLLNINIDLEFDI